MQNYEITMLCRMDDTLDGYEIKIPEKILEIFTPNAIGAGMPRKTDLKIIPNTDDFIVRISTKLCECLSINPEGGLIQLAKIVDMYKFGYWVCDFMIDKNLEKNIIILPAERLKNNFLPDFIYPVPTTPIDCASLNIQTSEESIGRISENLLGYSLTKPIQLYLYAKEENKMKKNYETRLLAVMDPELKANEIKVPENVLKVFTPNVISSFVPAAIKDNFKIIPIPGNTVYASVDVCRTLLIDIDIDVIVLSKVVDDDAYRICTKTCDAIEDKSLKENTIVVPKVVLEGNFKPDYITTFPTFDGPIEYDSINIETTNSSTAKVSTDIMNKIDLLHNLQLCFWIKECK